VVVLLFAGVKHCEAVNAVINFDWNFEFKRLIGWPMTSGEDFNIKINIGEGAISFF